MNRHRIYMHPYIPEMKAKKMQQIEALWIRFPFSLTLIHFYTLCVFHYFSVILVIGHTVYAVKSPGRQSWGRRWIYRRQFRSNFGKPLNVSYQYAMQYLRALFCVWIPPELFRCLSSFSSPCCKLNMKINHFCSPFFIYSNWF